VVPGHDYEWMRHDEKFRGFIEKFSN
jgi:hypothetical protein